MSYEIIYAKQFVKLRKTGEFIPMLLAGSNNCFDIGYNGRNGRRARSWSNDRYYNRKGKISEKPEVILKNVDRELNQRIRGRYFPKEDKPKDVRERFGYFASIAIAGRGTGGTSFNAYRAIYSNGIKAALTIEELHALGVHLYFHSLTYPGKPIDGIPESIDLATEKQYFEELKKWRAWQNGNGKSFWLGFHPHSDEAVLASLRRPGREARRKAKREKKEVRQDHYFVLYHAGQTLIKYTRRGYRYAFNKDGGKRFMSKKEAKRYRDRLIKANRYQAEQWQPERVNMPATFLI